MTQLQVDNFHIELHELIDYNCAVCLNAYMVMHDVVDIQKVISNKDFMDFLYIFINRNKSNWMRRDLFTSLANHMRTQVILPNVCAQAHF